MGLELFVSGNKRSIIIIIIIQNHFFITSQKRCSKHVAYFQNAFSF